MSGRRLSTPEEVEARWERIDAMLCAFERRVATGYRFGPKRRSASRIGPQLTVVESAGKPRRSKRRAALRIVEKEDDDA